MQDLNSKNISINSITKISDKDKDICLEITKQMKEDIAISIIRPDKDTFNIVAQIHFVLDRVKPDTMEYLIFVPKENYDIIEYMSTNNMLSFFKIENFNVDLIPIDIDLLSLERENSIKEIYIDNNYSSISDFANAVVKLETCFGKIKYKYIKGDLAEKFCELVQEKEKENNLRMGNNEILGMIVFDRSVDFITLMTTNYSCEGLIDEYIGINLGKIKVKSSLLSSNLSNNKKAEKDPNKEITYGLTSDINPFFRSISCMRYFDAIKYIIEIRDYYQSVVSQNKAGRMSMVDAKALKEISYFISKLKDDLIRAENLINFVVGNLFEKEHKRYMSKEEPLLSGGMPPDLRAYYDEFLYTKKDLLSLIKLMIIESLTQNGISDYQKLKREILNIFGFQKIFLFRDLETLGWLKEKSLSLKNLKNLTDITYSQIIEKFELINDNYNPEKIDDCSYILKGFCPLSLRIIEKAIYGKWNTISDLLKRMPGATYFPEDEKVISNPKSDKNIMLVVFIGGVTYTEIEAIRYLNRKLNEEFTKGKRQKTQLIILTTSILNSKKILENLGNDVHSSFNMKTFYEQANKKENTK